MKVGDYVRTHYGIRKIVKIDLDNNYIIDEPYINKFGQEIYCIVDSCIIGQPSSNPIDLIEVGDYVNGYKVLEIFKNNVVGESLIAFQNHNDTISSIYDDEIKSVVTKEQFSSMEYEIC